MGENLVGVCLLNGSYMHNKLALKLFDHFPKLINDINISEDYYGRPANGRVNRCFHLGLSPLHQAIINQDVSLVAWLLKRGADIHQRYPPFTEIERTIIIEVLRSVFLC